MIKSMTGYGRAPLKLAEEESGAPDSFTVEVKAVNHRYLDSSCRLNDRFFALEPLIKEELKKRFSRGSFMVLIYADQSPAEQLKINMDAARAYIAAAEELKKNLNIKGDLTLEGLLRLKDVFSAGRKSEDADRLWASLKITLAVVFDELDSWRAKEGLALDRDMRRRLAVLESLLSEVEAAAPRALSGYREKLRLDMEKILKDRFDEARLFAEAALYAEKTDISEEITRLKSHFRLFAEYLDTGGPVGKKLDFLCQEFFREINTIGSKALDAGITKVIVEMKGELEKIREQVQNIE